MASRADGVSKRVRHAVVGIEGVRRWLKEDVGGRDEEDENGRREDDDDGRPDDVGASNSNDETVGVIGDGG
jgi:hypothetical protein